MTCQKYREMETELRIMGKNYTYHNNKAHDDRYSKGQQQNQEMAEKSAGRFSELNHQMAIHRATCPDCKDVVSPPAKLDFMNKG
jgi:hypothetical protein